VGKAPVNQRRTFTALTIVFTNFEWHTRQTNNFSLSWRYGGIVLLLVDGTVGRSQGPLSFPCCWTQFFWRSGMGLLPTDHSLALEGIDSCHPDEKRQDDVSNVILSDSNASSSFVNHRCNYIIIASDIKKPRSGRTSRALKLAGANYHLPPQLIWT
jgi:hypothetical protein